MMSVRSIADPKASWAPAAMAKAALPIAATQTGPATGARAQRLAYAAATVHRVQPGLQEAEQQPAPRIGMLRQLSSRERL